MTTLIFSYLTLSGMRAKFYTDDKSRIYIYVYLSLPGMKETFCTKDDTDIFFVWNERNPLH